MICGQEHAPLFPAPPPPFALLCGPWSGWRPMSRAHEAPLPAPLGPLPHNTRHPGVAVAERRQALAGRLRIREAQAQALYEGQPALLAQTSLQVALAVRGVAAALDTTPAGAVAQVRGRLRYRGQRQHLSCPLQHSSPAGPANQPNAPLPPPPPRCS